MVCREATGGNTMGICMVLTSRGERRGAGGCRLCARSIFSALNTLKFIVDFFFLSLCRVLSVLVSRRMQLLLLPKLGVSMLKHSLGTLSTPRVTMRTIRWGPIIGAYVNRL